MCGQHSWVIAQCWWAGVWQDIERPTLTPTHPAEITWWWALPVFTVSLTIIWRPARPSDLISTQQNTSLPPQLPLWKHQAVWGHPARINCIIDHLLYIHTGNIVLLSHWWGAPHSWRQIGYQESNWSSVIWWRWQNIPIIHTRPGSLSPDIETCNSLGPARSHFRHAACEVGHFDREKRSKQKLLVSLKFPLWH